MRSLHSLFAFQLFAALALYGCGCFVPVIEKQCDNQTPCGSGWVCLAGVCYPPDGGKGGSGGGDGDGGLGGGAGGGLGGGVGGGGVGGGGGGGEPFCSGCRDASGQCRAGNSLTFCGANGAACSICQANQLCQSGVCVTPACSPSSCPNGCCRNGLCVAVSSQSPLACGLNGQSCASCPPTQTCSFGKCVPTCNSTTCGGCCSGDACLPVNVQTPTNCGSSGNVCRACNPGQECRNGLCTTPQSCSAATCPGGCCSNGLCFPYSAQGQFVCGAGGAQCTSCPPGATCTMGLCTATACSPSTCPGCCGPAGCMSGTAVPACGKNGQACLTCGPGQVCSAQTCTSFTKKIGDPCLSSFDCSSIGPTAYCKLQTSSGNGQYLNGFCTRPCSTDGGTACTPDSVCLNALQPYGEFDAFCSPRCSSTSQCRAPGYACYFINVVSTTACWLNPIPITGLDAGFSDAGPGNFIGSPCVNAGQCTNPSTAFCIQDVIPGLGASGFVGGYCSSLCSTTVCAAGSACVTVTGFSTGITQKVCLRDCFGPRTGQSNCRNGYVCEGTVGTPLGSCLPRCSNVGAVCPAGTACNTATGYCN